MELNSHTAISPIDGRYRHQVQHLDDYFSEYALIRYRVLVEVEYFLFLSRKRFFGLDAPSRRRLQAAAEQLSLEDALWIKETEKTTTMMSRRWSTFLNPGLLNKAKRPQTWTLANGSILD